MNDWIPSRENEFEDLCKKWVEELQTESNIVTFKWDADMCKDVANKIVSYLNAYTAYKENNSTLMRFAKDYAKKTAKAAIRQFSNTSVRFNINMDATNRLVMGIRPRESRHTPRPRPSSRPHIIITNTANRFEHRIKVINRENSTASFPDDAYGVQYAWQVGGNKPETGEELVKGKFTRRTTLIATYSEADKGKPVWYAARYENSRGEAGPWSLLAEAYVG
ncbi:MAG: hypothetical protein LBV41_03905 [Cytophagaceae bacterium]|jgi:hypothetical protein|nr:hypothetical protein [Cytophagaceae bacterium]